MGVDAHFGAGKTFDYFKNIQGRNGIWNTGVGARSRVHYGNGYANAFWDGIEMTYGDGAGNTHPLTELDIAGHEMTHGVTQNTVNLVYAGESGGLSEATSDIFGTAVEFYADNASDTPDYLIGELADIHGNGTPLRYLDRPSRDGVSRDCWSPTLGALDVHYSSGPLNHWFYLASEGSGGKTINGVSYNSPTCNASTVTPIGREAVARIWYRTLTTYLTSSSTYAAAREGAIQSARDLYGATSAECTSVEASFSAIDVPPGVATCGITPPPPSGSNLLSNPGFESGNTLWTATSAVIGQNGAWDQPPRSGTWNAWMGGYGRGRPGGGVVDAAGQQRGFTDHEVHGDLGPRWADGDHDGRHDGDGDGSDQWHGVHLHGDRGQPGRDLSCFRCQCGGHSVVVDRAGGAHGCVRHGREWPGGGVLVGAGQ